MSISIPNTPFVFGTKAQTLARLTGRLNNSHLCEQEIVELTEWQSDRQSVLRKILSRFASRSLVIRSSARHEDTAEASNAGAFLSVIGVEPNPDAIAVAIERVSNSYDDTTGDQERHDQAGPCPEVPHTQPAPPRAARGSVTSGSPRKIHDQHLGRGGHRLH